MPGYPRLALMALAYIRRELPGWGKLARALQILGPENDDRWQGAPRKIIRGKLHGYWMDLNLSDWSERLTYFLGRYHELPVLLLMRQCVHPGERVADVGANIGMLTLLAANLAGTQGTVEAFEPNPCCAKRITEALDRNGIRNVNLHESALSDAPGTLTLHVLQNHAGMGTLAAVSDEAFGAVTQTHSVPVVTGDSVLLGRGKPVAFIKVDVEGFETKALRGLREVLSTWHPVVTTEVIPAWLERAGSSVGELTELMQGLGYRGYGLETHRAGMRHRLHLAHPCARHTDLVWLPSSGSFADRMRSCIRT